MELTDRRVLLNSTVIAQPVGDEMVLLDLRTERYFGLDSVGTRIWQLLAEHQSTRAVYDRLLCEFDVAPTELANDLDELLAELSSTGLVQITDAADVA